MIAQERTSSSLDARLRDSHNALNFLRLVLAVSVIAAHAWPLGGYGEMPTFGGMPLGSWAVAGFFALSGYLIAGSRMRSGLSAFFWKRLLRLMPGFWVCLLVVAFVFAPISTRLMLGSEWTPAAAIQYVAGNAFLNISERGIEGTLPSTPYPIAWNGSLWTLLYEAGAYLVAGLVLSVALVRRRTPACCVTLLVVAVAASAARSSIDQLGAPGHIVAFGIWLAPYFVAGMLVWAFREQIRTTWMLVMGSALALVPLIVLGGEWVVLLAPLPWALLLLSLGALLPIRIGVKNDISYGVYIYAFPVQQLMATMAFHEHMNPIGLGAVAIALTMLPAWLSWRFVERPALAYKYLVGGKRARAPAPQSV